MKISINWLREYIDIRESPQKLKDDLTMIGLLVESILEVNGESVLELEATSNRPDCLCHLGVAREVAARYKRALKFPPVTKTLTIRPEEIPYKIVIKEPTLCPRYTGLVVDRVRVAPSPDWMQRRLEAAGMRPLNNIVDITNYVLLELGHPIHAFDFRRLRKGKIVVARARRGQKIVTLDGVERELDEQMLLINDGEGPVAIAGVMGGLHSEIAADTGAVLLECAYFDRTSVRRTSKRLGLSTEASYRFERGADWDDTVRATARCCYLIQELAGGRIAGSVQDVYPRKMKPIRITLRRNRAETLLGVKLKDSFVTSTLRSLQFRPVSKGPGRWQVTCPTFRPDMELEADLIEEVARYYGYQNIPSVLPGSKTIGTQSSVFPAETAARQALLGLGYHEGVNLSFATERELRQFPADGVKPVVIRNPLTEDTQFLRCSLLPGLVKTARQNFNHGIWAVRVFEIGKVYALDSEGRPRERNMLGILGAGCFAGRNWQQPAGDYDYFHMKGVVTALVRGMRSEPAEIVSAPGVCWLNPNHASVLMMNGKRLGVLGSLHPDLQAELKLKLPVYLAEIDFEELSRHALMGVQHQSLPKFPSVERDICVMVSRDVAYGAIRDGICGLGMQELISMDLIDVYEGEKIPQGKVSLTFRFTFQDRAKTLTVDQIQGFSDNILTFLRENHGAKLR